MRASPRAMIRAYNLGTQNLRFYEKIYRCFRISVPPEKKARPTAQTPPVE